MPFIANTPESLITRSDSKNPATTCRGITSTGRPCRRPLATPDAASAQEKLDRPRPQRSTKSRLDRHDDSTDQRMYCWQHKEQASSFERPSSGRQISSTATAVYLARNSVDTLADRLQMLSIDAPRNEKGPQLASKSRKNWTRRGLVIGSSFFSCCFLESHPGEAPSPPPRPKPHPTHSSPPSSSSTIGKQHAQRPPTVPQEAQYISLIPATILPQTAAALMAELTRPVSRMDEPGYIYMFWMTPESQQGAPPTEAARSLLVPPLHPTGRGQRRASDVVASFAARDRGASQLKGDACTFSHRGNEKDVTQHNSLLLKIGRANNVQRRLNEWKRQCGYNVSLIRYYPYISASSNSPASSSSNPVPRKMPHSHKVERLVHIELAGLGLRVADSDKCGACGRGHREWFRVEATRGAVAAVDGVIRRWSDWDEGRWQFS